jgi:hypothetical protein
MYDPNATAVEPNFLFGLLALQADLITRDNFIQACEEWSGGRELSFPRLLVQRGWLKAEDRREVERLVERKLARHGGDVRACLAELANNPLQGAFVSLQNRDLPMPVAMPADGQAGNNAADGQTKVRRRDWGDRELSHEVGAHGEYDEVLESPPARFPRWLISAGVIGVAVLVAVALGLVMIPPLAQQLGVGGQGRNGGGIFPRGFQQAPANPEVGPGGSMAQLVGGLYLALVIKDDVIEHIRRDPALTEDQRERALRLAEAIPQDPVTLNDGSWFVVREAGATDDAYRRALRMAEKAVEKNPGNGVILNTLGVAQYRVGKLAEALKTLKESDRLNRLGSKSRSPIAADLAFLALASFRLGEKDKAREYLEQLRIAVDDEIEQRRGESEAFLREAEQVIEGKVTTTPKARPKVKPKTDKDFTA